VFLSCIFQQLLLRNCAVAFVEIRNDCARKATIKAAKRTFNSIIRFVVVIVISILASLFRTQRTLAHNKRIYTVLKQNTK